MGKATNKHLSKPLLYIQQPEFPEISAPLQEKIFIHIDRTADESETEGKGKSKKKKRVNVTDFASREGEGEHLLEQGEEYTNPKSTSQRKQSDKSTVKSWLPTEGVKKELSDLPMASSSEKAQKGEANEGNGKSYKRIPIDGKEDAKTSGSETNIKEMIRRLALYPNVLQRPTCEATLRGERKQFQVLSKRGNFVRIKAGHSIETYHIEEFENFQILHPKKNKDYE